MSGPSKGGLTPDLRRSTAPRPGSKHHLIVDRHGTPLAVTLTSGNRHDVTQLMPLLDAIPPVRGLRGRPRSRLRRLFADRGFDFDKYRRPVRARGITPKIARRGTTHGSGLGRTRWVVERTFAWLHQFKRRRIRYEIRADLHLALLHEHHLLEATPNLILKRSVTPARAKFMPSGADEPRDVLNQLVRDVEHGRT
jgi:transposase